MLRFKALKVVIRKSNVIYNLKVVIYNLKVVIYNLKVVIRKSNVVNLQFKSCKASKANCRTLKLTHELAMKPLHHMLSVAFLMLC
jgi:hypothetical protein